MPQVYRQSLPPPRPEPRRRSSIAPQPIDADDSIVLSDLVRTGEASRLRRRGAMRIDHNTARASLAAPSPFLQAASAPPRPVVVVPPRTPTPIWAPPEPNREEEYTYGGGEWREWSGEDTMDRGITLGVMQPDEERRDSEDEEEFILFCGAEEEAVTLPQSSSHFKPTLFPGCPSGSASSHVAAGAPARRTNGCGAVVHMRACPQRPRGVWIGKEAATDVVVGMDACYFDRSVVAKMMKSACGCVREGVGCSVCGNPLGTRYLPCQAASEGIFNRHSSVRPQAPLQPQGPRYWHSRLAPSRSSSSSSSRTAGTSDFYIYTFFADHVMPSRPCAFAALPARPVHVDIQAPLERSRPNSPQPLPLPPPSYYGYRYTASPRPVSPYPLPPAPLPAAANPPQPAPLQIEVRGLEQRMEDEDVSMLDADGVPRNEAEDEPSSPDKWNETMVWPSR